MGNEKERQLQGKLLKAKEELKSEREEVSTHKHFRVIIIYLSSVALMHGKHTVLSMEPMEKGFMLEFLIITMVV